VAGFGLFANVKILGGLYNPGPDTLLLFVAFLLFFHKLRNIKSCLFIDLITSVCNLDELVIDNREVVFDLDKYGFVS
jgi:hypothetical protein